MSGPKVSVYQLTGQQRTWFYGQIRCEQSCISCANHIQELAGEVAYLRGELEKVKANIELAQERVGDFSEEAVLINGLLNKLMTEPDQIQQGLVSDMPQMSEKYILSQEALDGKKAQLAKLKALKKRLADLRNEASSVITKEAKQESGIIRKIESKIAEDVSGSTSFIYADLDSPSSPEKTFEAEKSYLAQKLNTLLEGKEPPEEIASEIHNAQKALEKIEDAGHLHSFDSITISKLKKRIKRHNENQRDKEDGFNEKYSRYHTLCVMAEIPPQAFLLSESSEREMDIEIQRIEMMLIKQQEQIYISECVDEVMSEMGYDLIGTRDVKKKSGKKFKNELFTFNEGTAVNVTYSSDGQIAMELGGIAREDHLPTEEEMGVLTRDMETFCNEFSEFERRLESKGIVVGNRIALSPPSAEYAAIINVSDYNIDAGKQVSEINAGEKRRGKAAEKKMIRRTE